MFKCERIMITINLENDPLAGRDEDQKYPPPPPLPNSFELAPPSDFANMLIGKSISGNEQNRFLSLMTKAFSKRTKKANRKFQVCFRIIRKTNYLIRITLGPKKVRRPPKLAVPSHNTPTNPSPRTSQNLTPRSLIYKKIEPGSEK